MNKEPVTGTRVMTPDGPGRVVQVLRFHPHTKVLVHVDGRTPAVQYLLTEIEELPTE